MDVKLNFINRSNDTSNSKVLIFQKNESTDFEAISVAWRVIKNCGTNCNHPFVFPLEFEVDANDSYGNFTPRMAAVNGELFSVLRDGSGNIFRKTGNSTSPLEVQVRNDLGSGSVGSNIYKDNRLLATKLCVVPNQKAIFKFNPTIWIGVASEVEEGEVISSAVLTDMNTEISLLGIRSADIIMSGGGCGTESTAFQFNLENVVLV